ncbi:Translation initiation factor IF-2 [Frankliniella fusca]|uniref:Translation initiation factor IF-2 n=1 Tax=Frankliniella fusca TaxID=407009 RepID=A0AAE1LLW2_9NEOP|nr:Translation initiation factor IF-2 [Frankliniella fusca]
MNLQVFGLGQDMLLSLHELNTVKRLCYPKSTAECIKVESISKSTILNTFLGWEPLLLNTVSSCKVIGFG